MSTSTRVRSHLRTNVIGYLALFFALTMGTAYATHPGGANTISTVDIINGEVKTADIGGGEVQTSDLGNDSVTGAKITDESIGNVDIKAGAVRNSEVAANAIRTDEIQDGEVRSPDVADNTLTGTDIANNSITEDDINEAGTFFTGDISRDGGTGTFQVTTGGIDSSDVADFSLSNQDINVFFAQVNANGTVANSSGGVTVLKLSTGTYEVDYSRNVSNCAFTTSLGDAVAGGAPAGEAANTDRAGNAEATFTTTFTSAGALADRAFQQIAVC